MKYFQFSFIFTAISLLIAGWWGYHLNGWAHAFNMIVIVLILGVLEVSLSFDNAVVNASVLKTWDEFWKKLFLTAGMLVAVFGMRLLFPLFIVAQTADMSLADVWRLALNNPSEYSAKLIAHNAEISLFGGVFLLLVFLNFIFDKEREVHWLGDLERRLGLLGRVKTIPVFLSLLAIVVTLSLVAEEQKFAVLMAGLWGIIIYIGVDIISTMIESEEDDPAIGNMIKRGSIGGFLYLEVLDASFSFDGVIGAFAITKDIIIIMLGLGIGAMFVRSLTIFLVEKETLDEYIYLEHGAHYAIGILAFIMLLSVKVHIPEIVTGLIGGVMICLSLWSSIRHKRNTGKKQR